MKKATLFLTLVLASGCASTQRNQPTIINYEAAGNLQVTNPVGCTSLNNLTTNHTPADIYPGLAKCIEENNIEYGSRLFFLAGTYGRYDILRVKDKTSHQALVVLQNRAYRDLEKSDIRTYMMDLKNEMMKDDSRLLLQICSELKKFGHPTYRPVYMIQHGLDALGGENNYPLKSDFDEIGSWENALNGYMHCNNTGHR